MSMSGRGPRREWIRKAGPVGHRNSWEMIFPVCESRHSQSFSLPPDRHPPDLLCGPLTCSPEAGGPRGGMVGWLGFIAWDFSAPREAAEQRPGGVCSQCLPWTQRHQILAGKKCCTNSIRMCVQGRRSLDKATAALLSLFSAPLSLCFRDVTTLRTEPSFFKKIQHVP